MKNDTKLKLSNGFEFTVDSLNVNYNPFDKSRSLTFIKHFRDIKIREIETELTPDNMKTIAVSKGGGVVYALEGFTEITSADINIDRDNQIYTVRAVTPKIDASGGDADG